MFSLLYSYIIVFSALNCINTCFAFEIADILCQGDHSRSYIFLVFIMRGRQPSLGYTILSGWFYLSYSFSGLDLLLIPSEEIQDVARCRVKYNICCIKQTVQDPKAGYS